MKVKEDSEKVGLKLNIQKTKIMASSPITSWQIYGQTTKPVTDFIFLGSKITADNDDCSHEIRRCLLLARKAMTNLDNILRGRDITLIRKVHLVKAIIFPVVMYGCESCTIRKAKCWRIDAFELWCWRKPLRVPKGDHSWVFIGRTDVEAETPILWPPVVESPLIRKAPDAGKDWRQEEKGTTEDEMAGWHRRLNGHEFEHPGIGEGQGSLVCCSPWGRKESDRTKQLNTTTTEYCPHNTRRWDSHYEV